MSALASGSKTDSVPHVLKDEDAMPVFVGGSKTLKVLPKAMADKLVELMDQDAEIIVGDCRGADALVQQFLSDSCYQHVTVFAMEGKARNNLGDWEVVAVPAPAGPKTWHRLVVTRKGHLCVLQNRKEYAYYRMKDLLMALIADCGLMAWNGKSKGTLLNLLRLVAQGKRADVVLPE